MTRKEQIATDGRRYGDYESRYLNKGVKWRIRAEATYITMLLVIALGGLFFNFLGEFEQYFQLTGERAIIFHKALYCVLAGLLGGATFGMKYFDRVVARGLWNKDRVFWRLFSPLIAVSLSVVMSAIMIKDVSSSSSMAITIGYLTGYFSDEAVSKMYDVACVLFLQGNNHADKADDKINGEQAEDSGQVEKL